MSGIAQEALEFFINPEKLKNIEKYLSFSWVFYEHQKREIPKTT